MISIVDPGAPSGAADETYELRADLHSSGIRIGLLSNDYPDASALLTALQSELTRRLAAPVIQLFEHEDPSAPPGSPASAGELQQIVEASDVVVCAIGQCGSCTSSTVRNAAAVARLGRPAVGLVSGKFLESARFVARSVGIQTIPLVELPHPVSGTGIENIERIAAQICQHVISALEGELVEASD